MLKLRYPFFFFSLIAAAYVFVKTTDAAKQADLRSLRMNLVDFSKEPKPTSVEFVSSDGPLMMLSRDKNFVVIRIFQPELADLIEPK